MVDRNRHLKVKTPKKEEGLDILSVVTRVKVRRSIDSVLELTEIDRDAFGAFLDKKSSSEEVIRAVEVFSKGGKVLEDFIRSFALEMNKYIFEWNTLVDEKSYQHHFHDFKLGTHMIKVFFELKRLNGYQLLSKNQKRMLDMVALLHDLKKKTGSLEQSKRGEIDADQAHPLKSAESVKSRKIFERMGYSTEDVRRGVRLIQYHDSVSNIGLYGEESFKNLPDPNDPGREPFTYKSIAHEFQDHPDDIALLELFVEADIRGVKSKDFWTMKQKNGISEDSYTAQERIRFAFKQVRVFLGELGNVSQGIINTFSRTNQNSQESHEGNQEESASFSELDLTFLDNDE